MRKYLVCLIVVLLLIALTSCTKKGESDESTTSSVPSTNAVVAVEKEKTEAPSFSGNSGAVNVDAEKEVVPEEKDEPLSLIDMTEDADAPIEEFYRGGKFFIKGYFDKEKGEIVFDNTEDDEILSILASFVTLNPDAGDMTFTLEDGTVTLEYSQMSVGVREEWWMLFVSFMNDYNSSLESERSVIVPKSTQTVKGTLNSEIYPDKIVLYIPSEMTDEELLSFASYLVLSYPELKAMFNYERDESSVTLIYLDGVDNGLASEYFDYLGDEIDSFFARLDVEETGEEEVVVETEVVEEDVDVVEPVAPPTAPQEEKGKFIREYSVALSNTFKGNLESGKFVNGVGLKGEVKFFDYLAAGIRVDFDIVKNRKTFGFGGYICGIYPVTEKIDLYGYVGLSYLVGIKNFKGTNAFALDYGIGGEYKFTSNWSVLAELTGRYAFNDAIRLDIGGTVGARYTF